MATYYTLEDAILIQVRRTGSCFIDDLVSQLSNRSWNEVFLAVEHLPQDGRLTLHRFANGSIQISLPASNLNMRTCSRQTTPSIFAWDADISWRRLLLKAGHHSALPATSFAKSTVTN
ncbi:hypothetical protein YTPLAS18_29950 [Nitrospira sp.]|nr:hypothetical protein YTPLAS18_29950 [Nitrospira sp.]